MADLVRQVLIWLETEWDTANYDPQPVLIHGDDSVRRDTGARTRDFDPTRGNSVKVSSGSSQNDAVVGGDGTSYHEEPLLTVEIKGLHDSKRGHISDSRDFRALKKEVKHILDNHRSHPLPGEGLRALVIDRDENLSSNYRDLYHWVIDLRFVGTR